MANRYPLVHALSSLDITVRFPAAHEHQTTSLAAHGRSSTRRSNLWTYQEYFDPEVQSLKGYALHDAVAHIVLASYQDRPNTLERLDFALSGGLSYVADELPFS